MCTKISQILVSDQNKKACDPFPRNWVKIFDAWRQWLQLFQSIIIRRWYTGYWDWMIFISVTIKNKWKLSLLHSLVLPKKLTMYCQFVWALLCWAPTLSKLPAPPSWCANIFFGISSWFFCIPIFVKIISPAQLVQPSKVWDSISFFLNPSCRMMKVKVVFIKGPFD